MSKAKMLDMRMHKIHTNARTHQKPFIVLQVIQASIE